MAWYSSDVENGIAVIINEEFDEEGRCIYGGGVYWPAEDSTYNFGYRSGDGAGIWVDGWWS